MCDVAPTATLTAQWMYRGLIAAIAGLPAGSPFQFQFAFNFFLFYVFDPGPFSLRPGAVVRMNPYVGSATG